MKRSFALMVSLAFAAGCAGPSVVRLHPEDPNTIRQSGREIVTHDVPGARISVSFERVDDELIAIRTEVENTGSTQLDFGPSNVSYRACSSQMHCSGNQPVGDPEAALVRLDLKQGDKSRGIDSLDDAKAIILSEALRRTTLALGDRVGGLVWLPVDRNAARIVVRVNVGTSAAAFTFSQQVIEPDDANS
jgi:hypothetical protein